MHVHIGTATKSELGSERQHTHTHSLSLSLSLSHTHTHTHTDRIFLAFKTYDTSGDGLLQPEELIEALIAFGMDVDDDEVWGLVR